ncbi:MAG TPA: RloB family protein [Petrotogaceae bacterium]|nr:RloB family protein [Petrotogaceae bacterium]
MKNDSKEIFRRQYLCICEGSQEEKYFEHLSHLLYNYPISAVTFKFGSIKKDITRQIRNIKYDKAVVFDHDGQPERFSKIVNACRSINGKNKDKPVFAYSNLNFDLWLILHKIYYSSSICQNNCYINHVRTFYNLQKYEDIKSEEVIGKILSQITLDNVKQAITNAKQIRSSKTGNIIKKLDNWCFYPEPDLHIHEFIEYILKDCGEL